ncbi:unnamed protein product [Wuchereria bancrofti]|uniref:G-protein coupled receptors family 1 profile domain-containing protein n=1 Tax=Wuchereria bancrofti TaxID=6293 RepID=A0A3P7DN34_WUCBA|nr:unnamed protein product [Wuchereria bancrofti]
MKLIFRKRMRTPVNMTLTAMACCDTVVLFSNLIYTTHYTLAAFANCHPKQWSYGWAVFLVCHAHLSLIGHSSSIWLSVMLALIRYMTLRSRRKVDVLRIHLRHSYMAIAFVVLFVTLMNTPNFLAYKIIEMKLGETCNITDTSNYDASAYVPGVSDLALEAHCLIFRMAFWISGTVFKMTPCLLLSSFVWLLMKILTRVQQNRLKLLYHSTRFYNGKYESKKKNRGQSKIDTAKTNTSIVYRADRTTRMLLTILCVFLITELPQGIMMVLSGILPEAFRRHIYNSLGDLLDLLSLCNSCTTFVIYCSMSEQFRNEFKQVFLPHSFFDYKLRWKLKRNYKESSSHSTTSASFKNAFELPRNALNRNIEGVCPAVTATSELPMESSMIWSQYAENNVPEKSNRNIGNMVNDEGPSLLHSSA